MRKLFMSVLCVTALLASCAEADIEVNTVTGREDFTATIAETRAELDGVAVLWNDTDELTIFTNTAHNRQYGVKSLSNGNRSATFRYLGYSGSDASAIENNYALYPYDANATLSGEVITTKINSEQIYNAEKVDLSNALMVAKSASTSLQFVNSTALLRFCITNSMPDSYTLSSIKLVSATNKIAGEVTIDLSTDSKAVVTDNGVNEITLSGIDTPITDQKQAFYVVIPATSFAAKELTVTFTYAEGVEKSFALPAFELELGSIKTIAYTINEGEDFEGETPETETKPANNEIWYTNGSTTKATTPYTTSEFGANIVSNTYDADKECWVIMFDDSIKSIGKYAFYNCDSLTSVTIPDSVTAIGNLAFSDCSSLTSVTIGNSVTEIGEGAFRDCSSLTSVTITDSVTSIGVLAFADCTSLTSFYGKFASVDNRCLIVNGELVAFAPAGLTEYTIPDSVTEIGEGAFEYCTSLTSVTIPDSVTSIGEGAFYYCTSLTSVTIPDSVTEIGSSAFGYCTSLTSFYGKFASVDNRCLIVNGKLIVFAPAGLTEYTIPYSVTEIGEWAFGYCTSLTSVTIPDSVTEIGYCAFYDCTSLTSITIPDSVTSIGNNAFWRCTSLTSITIPDSVTEIEKEAFADCTSLTSVTIGNSVTSIGTWAFCDCTSLKEVYCKPTTPPTGGSSMFYNNASGRKIYTPMELVTAYKSASYWSNYASDIVAYDFEKGEVVEVEKPEPGNPDEIENNQIWYTNGSTTMATTPYTTSNFGANIVSNTYDADKECWVIMFDGPVKSIGKYAFEDCTSLTSVTIPDSVTEIGNSAFYNCRSLTSVTIPNSVTTIGSSAFYYCHSLTNTTIPDSVIEIGVGAFQDCTSLTSVTISNSVTTIGNSAFYNCRSLTSVTIPDSVTSIGEGAFCGCKSLTSVTIPDSLTEIGEGAFNLCTSLTSVNIPGSVTEIGMRAFQQCKSLTSVIIPDSVTSIGEEAFSHCTSLTSFFGKFASVDNRCLIANGKLIAFAIGCGATEYTIPDSVTEIGRGAFALCYNLNNITIPDSLTEIGDFAFWHCTSLTSVTIPDSVTTIGLSAFVGCESLTSVYCKPTTPPTGDNYMFDYNASVRKIYVPAESYYDYICAEGWSYYASDIVGYNF